MPLRSFPKFWERRAHKGDRPAPYRLDDEQQARVRDCLRRDGLSPSIESFERFIGDVENSIDHFLGLPLEGTFREAHDALRDLWVLVHEEDPPIGLIRGRLTRLPSASREYIGRRAGNVMRRLGIELGRPTDESPDPFDRVLQWAMTANAATLIKTLRVLSSDGARIIEGRARGAGKRSRPHIEPVIMGEARGAGTVRHRGGRPIDETYHTLVMHLALDWLIATGEPGKSGRSDNTGFADLVHSVFQWLGHAEKAPYALRHHWATAKR